MSETPQIRFDDGAAYENFMGAWSRKVGEVFLDWLNPREHMDWIDVGCGNGAFTELLAERAAPHAIFGVDPSDSQLAYARERHKAGLARFEKGDAMALPATDKSFDASTLALAVVFVPEPQRAITEMVRVTRPGGMVSAYMWDVPGGGFPYNVLYDELKSLGFPTLMPPSPEASRLDVLEQLWRGAGTGHIETRQIGVERVFTDFETLWMIGQTGPRLSAITSAMAPDQRAALKEAVRARLAPDASGRIIATARANAITGRVPD